MFCKKMLFINYELKVGKFKYNRENYKISVNRSYKINNGRILR